MNRIIVLTYQILDQKSWNISNRSLWTLPWSYTYMRQSIMQIYAQFHIIIILYMQSFQQHKLRHGSAAKLISVVIRCVWKLCVRLSKMSYQLYTMILSTNAHKDNDWNLFNIHYNWSIVFLHTSHQINHNKIQQLGHIPPLICCKTNFCFCISAPYNCKTTTLAMNTKLGKHSGAKDNYAKKEFVIKLH